MRRAIFALLGGLFVLVSGCGVSESDYKKAISERDALESNLVKVQKESDALKEQTQVLRAENRTLKDQIAKLRTQLEQWQEMGRSRRTENKKVSEPEARFYVVEKGDTLWRISRQTGVPLDILRELNDIQGSRIKPGQKLRLEP